MQVSQTEYARTMARAFLKGYFVGLENGKSTEKRACCGTRRRYNKAGCSGVVNGVKIREN
jgi:hypothetical protein